MHLTLMLDDDPTTPVVVPTVADACVHDWRI